MGLVGAGFVGVGVGVGTPEGTGSGDTDGATVDVLVE